MIWGGRSDHLDQGMTASPAWGQWLEMNPEKVIGYGVRIKGCRHVHKGEIPPPNECHKNFDGTSKAM